MAKLVWVLPAPEAHQLFQQICADAESLPKDDRTTDQKRSDVLLDRLLGTRTNWNVRTFVTISMETLLGLTNDPGQSAGYGAIAADAARELAMQGPFRGLLLDEYRQLSAISTGTYRPTVLMKEAILARSAGICTAPGCTRPVQEHDHIHPVAGGSDRSRQPARPLYLPPPQARRLHRHPRRHRPLDHAHRAAPHDPARLLLKLGADTALCGGGDDQAGGDGILDGYADGLVQGDLVG